MKKITALLLAVMMVFAFAACGSSAGPEPETEPETTTAASDTTHRVSGLVEGLDNGQLSIFTEANQELTFNIENAEIETEDSIKAGDTATVEYTGKISNGDTSGCEVTRVVDVAAAVTIIEGTVKSVNDDNTVTVTSNGRDYTFDTKEKPSVKKGDTVKIKYAGVISGTDTSHAYVRTMELAKEEATDATETTENAVSLKAVNDTVWASTEVNVREEADASSAKVGTIKKGTKLTRTGVLSNGWSRVQYKDKDRYIASSYLTTKDPAKKETKTKETKTKATEKKTETKTKATEKKTETKTKATETKTETEPPTETETEPPTETETEPPTETETEPPTETETEPPTETETEPPTETDPPEPETVTVQGIVTEVGATTLTLDNGQEFNIKGATCDISGEEALGQKVAVEYIKDTDSAVHVYLVGGEKSIGADVGSGDLGRAVPIVIVLVLIAIAAAAAGVVIRGRRKPESK